MKKIIVALTLNLLIGANEASAFSLVALSHLDLSVTVDQDPLDDKMTHADDANRLDAVIDSDLGALSPSAAPIGYDLDQQFTDDQSPLVLPVTGSISMGVSYNIEESEDLAADMVETGSASADYVNHKVLLRANWRFN